MPRYFAELDINKVVQRVIVADSLEWCVENLGGTWAETFIDNQDKNYAAIGAEYREDKSNFVYKNDYPSWTLDEKLQWQPPVPYPKNVNFSKDHIEWKEANQTWETKPLSSEVDIK